MDPAEADYQEGIKKHVAEVILFMSPICRLSPSAAIYGLNGYPLAKAARLSSDRGRHGKSGRLISHSIRVRQPSLWQLTAKAYSGP